MANRNFANSRMYTGHVMPVLLDCNFVVDSTNGNGLGIRSLKGPYIQNVFMHTSATPGAGSSNPQTLNTPIINPNPASGTIIVQLQDNYSRSYTGDHSFVSPLSGSALAIDSGSAALTAGSAYVITTLGTASLAQWQAIGVPKGVTPAVGVSFIALVTGSGAVSTSRVMAPTAAGSGIASIETVGDPNGSISPSILAQGFGAQLILECRSFAGSIAAPADGTVISLSFLLSNSSILVASE